MLVLPAVRGLQETWIHGRIIRLNMSHELNATYAKTLNVVELPAFILFDATGRPLRRWVGEAPMLQDLEG